MGLILTLTDKLSVFQTWKVFLDPHGNEKDRKKSDDLTDVVSDGFIMPMVQRFVLYPLTVALPVYYGVVFILSLFEPMMPFLFIIIFVLLAIRYRSRFVTLSRRANRYASANALSVVNIAAILIMLVLWFFLSTNKFTPYFGTHAAQKEYNEKAELNRISDVKNLAAINIKDIPKKMKGVYDRYEVIEEVDDFSGQEAIYNFYLEDEKVMTSSYMGDRTLGSITYLSSKVPTNCRVKPGFGAKGLLTHRAKMDRDYTGFYLDGYYITVKNMSPSFEKRRQQHYAKATELVLKESDFTDDSRIESITFSF
ncbi:MAG: hypothetical protein SNJ33_00330 [Rikenellaceae bacterium]